MRHARSMIDDHCANMKPGQRVTITRRIFLEAYPCGWPSIYETPEQAFLSSKIGSAWGCWRVTVDPFSGDRIISRHEESDRRVYVDPDRAHLFERGEDGFLKIKS
jgi:hypothetical protein